MSAAKETKTENPLFSRNIPAAPPISPPPAAEPEQSITVSEDQGKTVKRQHSKTVSEDQGNRVTDLQGVRVLGQHSKTVSEDQGKTVKRQSTPASSADDPAGENATVELSLYLRPSQDDKLEDLRREYKRLMKKKISANEVIRRLIDKATLNDLF